MILRRLVGCAAVIVLACLAANHAPSLAQEPSCPPSETVIGGGQLGANQSSPPHPIDLLPCQTVVVTLTSGFADSRAEATGHVTIRNSSNPQQTLIERWFTCIGTSCSFSTPPIGSSAGYPMPGTRGAAGLAKDVVVRFVTFNLHAQAPASYALTIVKEPRAGYNTGGDTFANAPLIDTRVQQTGSLHYREIGQYYKVHLEPGQVIFARGHARSASDSNFILTLYSPSQQVIKDLASVYVTTTPKTFPAVGTSPPLYTNTTGVAGVFYIRARSSPNVIQDFDFTIATPTLTVSPQPVTRGDVATAIVEDLPTSVAVSNWRFASATGLPQVIRTVNTSSVTWPGKVVGAGTISATLGNGYPLSVAVQVAPRPNWEKSPPASAEEITNSDHIICGQGSLYPANPPKSSADAFGWSCQQGSYSFTSSGPLSDNGPNHGYRYLLSINTSGIAWRYVISPALRDTASPFYACQTGVPPVISGANLASGTRRHEGGSQNSHFATWAAAWSVTANNYGVVAETIVTGNVSDEVFNATVVAALAGVTANLNAAAALEPCDVNFDDVCSVSRGVVSFCVQ